MIFDKIAYTFAFLFGLATGSFLNCLIYRLEIGEKPTGNSFCPRCKNKLSAIDLIPILSYIFLKGKCRYCDEKISIQYPLVELLTGAIFLSTLFYVGLPATLFEVASLIFILICFSLLVVVFVYDLKHYIILNKIIYPAILAALGYIILEVLMSQNIIILVNHLVTGILFFLFFFSIYLITSGEGIGFGDVRYSFFLGLFLGFPAGLIGLFFSFIIGAIIGILLIIFGDKGRKDVIPFGPFLVAGTFVAFFFSELIIEIYFYILL